VVAFAHAAGCTDNGPDGEAAAEGDEGLFAEATPYLVEGVFVVEFAVDMLNTCHFLLYVNVYILAQMKCEGRHTSSHQKKRGEARCLVVLGPP
jgi:hypothetical protein